MMYSLDEIGILPSSKATDIVSRSECDPLGDLGTYPIFVSPMTSVIDESNYQFFTKANVLPIIPRRVDNLQFRLNACNHVWCAFSLKEFEMYFCEGEVSDECPLVLIDLANGHMKKIYELVKKAKERWGTIIIMVGNIAHPDLYWECYDAEVDYVRVGIGTGSVCTTGVKTGIHASMEWLLRKLSTCKTLINASPKPMKAPKIIADGGISTIDRAIKCLALGADYVMMGKMFAQCTEACGISRIKGIDKDPQLAKYLTALTLAERDRILNTGRYPKERLYYGMASERGQKDISNTKKAEEGIEIWVPVEYTLESLLSQFDSALRSAMSYTGCRTLQEFKNVEWEYMSPSERNAYYK